MGEAGGKGSLGTGEGVKESLAGASQTFQESKVDSWATLSAHWKNP